MPKTSITFKVTHQEKKDINSASSVEELTTSDYVRQAVMSKLNGGRIASDQGLTGTVEYKRRSNKKTSTNSRRLATVAGPGPTASRHVRTTTSGRISQDRGPRFYPTIEGCILLTKGKLP